jgi:hypothetical protein
VLALTSTARARALDTRALDAGFTDPPFGHGRHQWTPRLSDVKEGRANGHDRAASNLDKVEEAVTVPGVEQDLSSGLPPPTVESGET